MLRVATTVCFLCLVGVSSAVAQTAPDSTTAVPPSASDSSTTVPSASVVPPAPDSSATVPSASTVPSAPDSSETVPSSAALPITVILKDGTERHYVRVERSGSFLIGWRLDGGTDNIRVSNIVRIMGDQTSDVLKEGLTAGKQKEKKGSKGSGKPFLRGQPLPDMKLFLMVQSGVLMRADDHSGREEDGHGWLDVGGMKNLSPKIALGGTLGVADDGKGYTRITVKPRLRTWLGKGYAFDVAPGVFFPTGSATIGDSKVGSVGFTGELAFVASDWAAVTYVVEAIEAEKNYYAYGLYDPLTTSSGTEVFHYIGLKAGGAVGLFLGALTFAGLFAN